MNTWEARTDAATSFLEAAAAHPERVLLAMDFDGTLAPIVPDPDDSRLLEASAEAFADLGPLLGQIAIVTGRGVATVRRLGRLDERAGLERLVVLGQYGAERWDALSGAETPAERPAAIDAVRGEVDALLAAPAFAGVAVEDKGRALGIHTRRSADPRRVYAELLGPLTSLADKHSLTLEPGRSVLELRASASTKGEALGALVAETGASIVAMCGDDLGDLPAFDLLEELRQQGAVTCAVVSSSAEQPQLAERADVLADGPEGVAAWLHDLAATIASAR